MPRVRETQKIRAGMISFLNELLVGAYLAQT